MNDEQGYRIWEIDDKTKVPRELIFDNSYPNLFEDINKLDWDNKTYAIRIGKKGLQ